MKLYNKRRFNKTNDKKLLHKVKKQWVTISVALLALIGGSALISHVNVSANSNSNGNNNTQNQTNGLDQSHSKLITAPHSNVQNVNNNATSIQDIKQKANQVHKHILTHAMMNGHITRTNSSDNNAPRRIYGKAVNGKPVKNIGNISHLHMHHVANYRGHIFSRINTPFKHVAIKHTIRLYNQISLNGRYSTYSNKHRSIRLVKAYKQHGHKSTYTRYLIHIYHRNYYISGNKHLVSFVAPSKHYKYYQHKIDRILNNADNHKFNKVRRAAEKLSRKHITNYKRYMSLYINAYNLQQDIQHPAVINYHHRYVYHGYNHTHIHNNGRPTTNKDFNNSAISSKAHASNTSSAASSNKDLINSLEMPASNASNSGTSSFTPISLFSVPNVPAPINPFSSSNNQPFSSSTSIHNMIPNKPASNSNNSDMNSYYASSAAQSADNSIANSYKNSVSASVSIVNQNKAKSAASSADQSIENSIASSAKISADNSVAASVSNSVSSSLSRLDSSIADSYAKSAENTGSYKNSVNAANSRAASLAAKLADRNLDDFIAGSYAKSADNSIANSYKASVDNSVSSLDQSIANSAAQSADKSIANSYIKSADASAANSKAKSVDDSIANSYKNSVSVSVSTANQIKARSAAESADKSIDNSIASSTKYSADSSIAALYSMSVSNSVARIDQSVANSAAQSTENTNSYKDSVSNANNRIASLAAQSADNSIDASIANSAKNSADTNIVNSYKSSVSNSVAQLDKSIADSAAKSADKSIANEAESASQASVINQFTGEILRDVNQARYEKNLSKLQVNSDLENVSKLQANQLVNNANPSFESDVNKLGYMELTNNIENSEIMSKFTDANASGKLIADKIFENSYNRFLSNAADIGIGVAYNNKDKNYHLIINETTKIPNIPKNERYLTHDNNGKSVTLGNIYSDGTYSNYNYSPTYGLSHVINKKNVLGYNFDEVNFTYLGHSNDFWVFSDELSTNPSARFTNVNEWNDFIKTRNNNDRKYYNSDEFREVTKIRNQYNSLLKNDNSTDISTPKKEADYRKQIVKWVNFYRSLHGLKPVVEDKTFDKYAQQNAEQDKDPECKIPGDVNAKSAVMPSEIGGYYTDTNDADHNGTPGHRTSLLNPRATRIGVGEQGSVNTLYFGQGINNPIVNQSDNITYPNAGIYPINYVNQNGSDYWGYSFINPNTINDGLIPEEPDFFKSKLYPAYPGSYNGIQVQNPHVSVYDEDTHENIEVSDTHTDNSVDGTNLNSYSGAVYYKVNTNALRANHTYKITISGQGIPTGSYTYYTKLYEL